MSAPEPPVARSSGSGEVCLRFWASARAAAGVAEVSLPVTGEVGLDVLVEQVLAELPEREGLGRVLAVCSVLVGDRPTGAADRAEVVVAPGATVEFLPPFAGG